MPHDSQKKMQKYMNSIERKLNMPKEVKTRVMNDFASSIHGRREAGKTDEEIYAELGSPTKAAAELNEQMREYTYVKSPWRWVCFALIILCSASLIFGNIIRILVYYLTIPEASSIGIIGGADGPTAILISRSSDHFIYRIAVTIILLVISIVAFRRLSRCARK